MGQKEVITITDNSIFFIHLTLGLESLETWQSIDLAVDQGGGAIVDSELLAEQLLLPLPLPDGEPVLHPGAAHHVHGHAGVDPSDAGDDEAAAAVPVELVVLVPGELSVLCRSKKLTTW